jgi:hypothetical protein
LGCLKTIQLPIPLAPLHLFLVFGAAFGISMLAAASPRTWWARALFSSLGPRLDADRMSKRQCARAALGFFTIAGLGMGASAGITWFGDRLPGIDGAWLHQLLMLLYGIVGMTGLGAGVYLTIKALLKPRLLPLSPSLEYLKEYVAADGRRRVRLTEHADRTVAVSLQCCEEASPREWGAPRIIAHAVSLAEAEAIALEETGYPARPRRTA